MRGSRGIIISNVKQYIFVVHPENRWIMSAVTVPCIQPRSGNSHIGKSKGSFGTIAHIMGNFTIRPPARLHGPPRPPGNEKMYLALIIYDRRCSQNSISRFFNNTEKRREGKERVSKCNTGR